MKINRTFFTLISAALITGGCWSMGANTTRSANSSETPAISTGGTSTPTPTKASPPVASATPKPMSDDNGYFKNLPSGFERPSDEPSQIILREYGAMYVARGGATPPNKVVFKNEAEVTEFQSKLTAGNETIGGVAVSLQRPALDALKAAIADAKKAGKDIQPNAGDSSKRNYEHTVTLWSGRVRDCTTFWIGKGKVTAAQMKAITSKAAWEQVADIFELEKQGIFFAKGCAKPIMFSVAPPGSSQHISMLALDVKQHADAAVRTILAEHGWFQTVTSDLPHFTFLGVKESELPGLGLKRVENGGRVFWVPDI